MSKEVLISSNGIKQAIDDLVNEKEELQERIDKALKELICLDGSLTNGRISDNICYIIEILKGE